ncbi:MAG: DUF4153 domain-containing protein [Hyphomicrobiaceae bacterium]
MDARTRSGRIRTALPAIAGIAQRFPLALAGCVLLAAYLLGEFHHRARVEDLAVRIPLGLTATVAWGLAAALLAQSRAMPRTREHLLALSGAAVLAALVLAGPRLDLTWGLAIAALALGVGLAAQTGREPHNGAFWLFNHNLWLGCATSLIGAILFGGGISAILGSLQYLFGLKIPVSMHEKVWIVALTLVAPIYWMSLIPRDLDAAVVQGEQNEFASRSIAVLVQFILVPLLLVYATILHVYAVKIGIEQTLPKGRLGALTLSYGAAMAATALAGWPTRHTGGPLVALFWRAWPWLLLVPVLLLAIAIGVRIQDYGLTPQRYMIALAGVWLALVGIAIGVRGEKADLRVIPAVLALLVAFASLGPWGMAGWSIRNQVSGLLTRLEAAGLVRDGRVADPLPLKPALASDRQRIAGAIDYIDRAGRLDLIAPLFAGTPQNPFESATLTPGRSNAKLRAAVRERLGLAGYNGTRVRRRYGGYYARKPGNFTVAAGGELIGILQATQRVGGRLVIAAKPQGVFTTTLDGTTLRIAEAGGQDLRFDITPLTATNGELARHAFGVTDARENGKSPPPLAITANIDGAEHTLIIVNAAASRVDADAQIVVNSLNFWLIRPHRK